MIKILFDKNINNVLKIDGLAMTKQVRDEIIKAQGIIL